MRSTSTLRRARALIVEDTEESEMEETDKKRHPKEVPAVECSGAERQDETARFKAHAKWDEEQTSQLREKVEGRMLSRKIPPNSAAVVAVSEFQNEQKIEENETETTRCARVDFKKDVDSKKKEKDPGSGSEDLSFQSCNESIPGGAWPQEVEVNDSGAIGLHMGFRRGAEGGGDHQSRGREVVSLGRATGRKLSRIGRPKETTETGKWETKLHADYLGSSWIGGDADENEVPSSAKRMDFGNGSGNGGWFSERSTASGEEMRSHAGVTPRLRGEDGDVVVESSSDEELPVFASRRGGQTSRRRQMAVDGSDNSSSGGETIRRKKKEENRSAALTPTWGGESKSGNSDRRQERGRETAVGRAEVPASSLRRSRTPPRKVKENDPGDILWDMTTTIKNSEFVPSIPTEERISGRRGEEKKDVQKCVTPQRVKRREDDSVVVTKRKWKCSREFLARKWFSIFNEKVFSNQLPAGLEISWNVRLLKTAGQTLLRRVKNAPVGTFSDAKRVDTEPIFDELVGNFQALKIDQPLSECVGVCKIELSTKVVIDETRLCSTLLHECCHAAQFLLDREFTAPHGPMFRKWARHASAIFPKFSVKTTHRYFLEMNHHYSCTQCGCLYRRYTKSLDVSKARCGVPSCSSGILEYVGNVAKKTPSSTPSLESPEAQTPTFRIGKQPPMTPRSLSEYQNFVKTHFPLVRKANPGVPTGQLMKEVAQMWKNRSEGPPSLRS